jgi:hypothetical protein
MNMDDDTDGQPIVWRPALSDAAHRQTDNAPLRGEETPNDRDIFGTDAAASAGDLAVVWPGL